MQTTRKKPSIPMIVVGAFLSAYLGYLVNGAWKQGMEFAAFLNSFEMVLSYPLRDYYNATTPKAILVALLIFAVAMVMYYTSQKNYMPGKEYGTSELVDAKQVNRILADEEDSNNRIFSQNIRMSLDTRKTKLNNNVLVIGGSGAGKTFYFLKGNLMQGNSSFIITDPKGEILRAEGEMLKRNGYNVKVINLLEMEQSNCYNPFSYIREETDVVKLITNLMSNTTPKGAAPTDPFWDKAESMFLQALFYYVWLEMPASKRNFASVLSLMNEAEVTEKNKPSKLDMRMQFLAETSPLGQNHPAVKQYNKCMRGAGDTVRSIIISANSRLAALENKQVLRLLSHDELNLADIGIGVNGDGKTKTALFCVIPDSDKTYNFIIGMLYTQIFQELYYQADFNCGGRLPIHVSFMLDEFANVALPDDYCSLLSTMRSREISSVIIIQNLAQIKALFKDTWETIPGNCDTLVYLGGNEQSTHEYISKLLGKSTIDKKSSGETKGRQGSSSRNYDVLGREIMMPDEVRKMDNKKCLVFIRGLNPVLDNKYSPFVHPLFSQTEDGGAKPYVHRVHNESGITGPSYEFLNKDSLKHYEMLKEKGEEVYIDSISYEDFMKLGHDGLSQRLMEIDEQEQINQLNEENEYELEVQPDERLEAETFAETQVDKKNMSVSLLQNMTLPEQDKAVAVKQGTKLRENTGSEEDSVSYRMLHWKFSPEQKKELKRALDMRLPKKYILSYAYPENSVIKMMQYRKEYEKKTDIS
jgi:type IV secretion system protein VirD4